MPDYEAITKAVASEDNQPNAAFDALKTLTEEIVGVKLFTVTIRDPVMRVARRIYSNMPDAYPVSGTKPSNESDWSRHVIVEKRTFVANDIEGIAKVFSDYELIQSLGCESVINVPVVLYGNVRGTINCLHEAGFYTPEKVQAAEALKLPGAVCLLLNESLAKGLL